MAWRQRAIDALDAVPKGRGMARLVRETVRICLRYRVTGLASEAGFFMLLSLPPLILGVFGGIGYVGQRMGRAAVHRIIEAVHSYAANFLTESSITQILLPTIDDVLSQGRAEFISVGLVLSVWAGSRALNVFVDTISIMYGQSGVRGIVRTRVFSLTMYAFGVVVGVVVVPLVLLGPGLIRRWLPEQVAFLGGLYWPILVLSAVAALTTLYHVATPRRAPWWRDIPGAVLALGIWLLASVVVRESVAASLGGPSIYGPLSAPIILLIWLYAVSIAVLIGAGLNAATRVLWPVELRASPRARLVHWAREEVGRRRAPGTGPGTAPGAADGSSGETAGERFSRDQQYTHPESTGRDGSD